MNDNNEDTIPSTIPVRNDSIVQIETCEIIGRANKYGPRGFSWVNLRSVSMLLPVGDGYEMYITYGQYYGRYFVTQSEWKRITEMCARQ